MKKRKVYLRDISLTKRHRFNWEKLKVVKKRKV